MGRVKKLPTIASIMEYREKNRADERPLDVCVHCWFVKKLHHIKKCGCWNANCKKWCEVAPKFL